MGVVWIEGVNDIEGCRVSPIHNLSNFKMVLGVVFRLKCCFKIGLWDIFGFTLYDNCVRCFYLAHIWRTFKR